MCATATLGSLHLQQRSPETPQNHGFGHERGREGSPRAHIKLAGSHGRQDAPGMPNGPPNPQKFRKTGQTGPGPPAPPPHAIRVMPLCGNLPYSAAGKHLRCSFHLSKSTVQFVSRCHSEVYFSSPWTHLGSILEPFCGNTDFPKTCFGEASLRYFLRCS